MEVEGISASAVEPMVGAARARTWEAVGDIAALITPGMTERERFRTLGRFLRVGV